MRTGRITLYAYDERGVLHTKAFNFSFSRHVNYFQANRILSRLRKPSYYMYFRGGVRKTRKNPVMSWGEVCAAVRDWRFHGEVSKTITIPLKGFKYITWQKSKFRGKVYTFISLGRGPNCVLVEALCKAGLDPRISVNGNVFVDVDICLSLKDGVLTIRAMEPMFPVRIEEL